MKPETKAFLDEYMALCEKYGMFIHACGCCTSPWITEVDEDSRYGLNLPEHRKHLVEEAE